MSHAFMPNGARRTDERTNRARGWWLCAVVLCGALLAPLLLCAMPALGDYPNHLARAYVLSCLPADAVLARMYAAAWSVIPNLGIDLILVPLMHVLPVHVAGRLVLGLAALLPLLGVLAYNRALIPGGPRWWPFGAGLCVWSGCLLYGFLNFVLSIGLALLLAAAWLRWRETRPARAIVLAMIGTPVLFACHLMGLVFFGVLAGSAELARLRPFRTQEAMRRALVLALVFTIPAGLYGASELSGLGGDAIWLSPADKIVSLRTGFVGWNSALSLGAMALGFGVPLVSVVLRRGYFPPPAGIAVLVLVVLYAVLPYGWKGTFLLDIRFAVMLALMMFAGFVPRDWPRPLRGCVAGTMVVLTGLHIGDVALAFSLHGAVLADLRAALAPVTAGQTVMVADADPSDASDYWRRDPFRLRLSDGVSLSGHLGALALIEARAFWPFQFDNESQQPIRTLEPYRSLALKAAALPDRTRLLTMDLCGFDVVLLTNAEAAAPLPENRFQLLASKGFARSYRITACRSQ